MGIVDGVDLDLGAGMAEIELLQDLVILVNVTCSFDQDVSFHTVYLVGDGDAQVLGRGHPWQRVTTEDHGGKWSRLLQEGQAFCFTLLGIYIGTKPKIV